MTEHPRNCVYPFPRQPAGISADAPVSPAANPPAAGETFHDRIWTANGHVCRAPDGATAERYFHDAFGVPAYIAIEPRDITEALDQLGRVEGVMRARCLLLDGGHMVYGEPGAIEHVHQAMDERDELQKRYAEASLTIATQAEQLRAVATIINGRKET